jgi:hypothetical protein
MEEVPPAEGRLLILEPYVPEGQWERQARAVGPTGHNVTWLFEVTVPIGWEGVTTTRLLMTPRYGNRWLPGEDSTYILDGCLDVEPPSPDEPPPYVGFIAQYIGHSESSEKSGVR